MRWPAKSRDVAFLRYHHSHATVTLSRYLANTSNDLSNCYRVPPGGPIIDNGRHLWDLLPQPTLLRPAVPGRAAWSFRPAPDAHQRDSPLLSTLFAGHPDGARKRPRQRHRQDLGPGHATTGYRRPLRDFQHRRFAYRFSVLGIGDVVDAPRRAPRSIPDPHSPINWRLPRQLADSGNSNALGPTPSTTTPSSFRRLRLISRFTSGAGFSKCGISFDAARFLNFQWPSSRTTMSS